MFELFNKRIPSAGNIASSNSSGNWASSPLSHLVVSMAIAIITAAAAALPTYFLTQGNMMWTAIAVGGGAALPGLITYLFLRCVCRRSHSPFLSKQSGQESNLKKEKEGDKTEPDEVQRTPQVVEARCETQRASEVAATQPDGGKDPVTPVVKGTICIKTTNAPPIRQDQHFQFGRRIKKENGEPLTVKEDDLYLELDITFDQGKEEFCVLNKEFRYFVPSSLFNGVQEGETFRFLYDEILIEWTCRQTMHLHPSNKLAIEAFIERAKQHARWERTQYGWADDIEGEPVFMDRLLGRELYEIDVNGTQIASTNFAYYEDDMQNHGPYRSLKARAQHGNHLVLNVHSYYVDQSDIKFFESKGFHDLHQLWIIIPHKPEKNRLPDNVDSMLCDDGTNRQTFDRASFNPQKGDRLPQYEHGQYFMWTPRDVKRASLFFNENGWLTLNIERRDKNE